jgi:simple sugar transport system substrate-binding protein
VIRSIRCCLVLVLVLAACGETRQVREPDLVVEGDAPAAPSAPESAPSSGGETLRISVVTHGQAANPFWVIVRNGIDAAARQLDVSVSYRAPDTYSVARMRTLIDAAVAGRPDGLVVSIPSPGVEGSIRRAIEAGIPVISINSGSDVAEELGVLTHVGQPEDRAGLAAGRRLARAGVRRALCVNQQVGNIGLDARCDGLARAMREVGGRSRVLGVDDQSSKTPDRIAAAIDSDRIDGVLAANATSGLQSVEAVASLRRRGTVEVGAFDLGPDTLHAVQRGELLFAVDQQPYLQGYLPIVLLANRTRYGLLPAQGDVVATGANFVTRENAAQALELSERSIR